MVELRELRANRIGITFADKFRRDPFRFVSNSLLLWMLYGITRPVSRTTTIAKKAVPAAATSVPARTFAPVRGQLWGNDDPDVDALTYRRRRNIP
jgi:hypothetical protein